MDADFSVELGPPCEEAVLELPWDTGIPHGPRYFDLKQQPELLAFVDEAVRYPELGEFLRLLNSRPSPFETAKCDVWFTEEFSAEEQIYGSGCKLGCYVDLVFSRNDAAARLSFFDHEELAVSLVKLLKKAPEISAACEVIVRRCYYHATEQTAENGQSAAAASTGKTADQESPSESGFYLTLYLSGYGKDEEEARRHWQIALRLTGNALLQLSGRRGPNRQHLPNLPEI